MSDGGEDFFGRFPACTSDSERFARLRLARTHRIGPVHFHQLILRFGSAVKAVENLPLIARRAGGGIVPASLDAVEAEMARGRAAGARLVVLGDAAYPKLLADIPAAPPVLWMLGEQTALPDRAIAIVGARNASAAGQRIAHALARELGEAGFFVVSGLARGIDTQAHTGSLKTGTAAVLGGGVDDIYPPDNADLYQAIRTYGVLISESPVGYRARAGDFPRRNRVISGLTRGTIVVEAELKSGSLITARLANEQGREVFAVPGSPLDPRCRGTNDLIRQGATLCEGVDDILRTLDAQMTLFERPAPVVPLHAVSAFDDTDLDEAIESLRDRLLSLISPVPTPREDLLRLSGAPAHVGLAALGELEIAGLIVTTSDGQYIRA
ncbi:DNA-processing protein DprA [Asticcacaulis excentricus]|uniref:Rossmann fold nucleotide-binding protein Smf n=1 Tax=Asticcacaulis excentricus TaxID=78587 RepID=A0A3G9G9B0_9CAUL|nr:DNA-processing protein DprA [Asticcacaulis excentricus]BBF81843.1 Rossmann fold nucleotide-binding protein Smf [Asticcacaulis excentricus]